MNNSNNISANNINMEILLIVSIFVTGITLCFTVSILLGIGFILIANMILPLIIQLSRYTKSESIKLNTVNELS